MLDSRFVSSEEERSEARRRLAQRGGEAALAFDRWVHAEGNRRTKKVALESQKRQRNDANDVMRRLDKTGTEFAVAREQLRHLSESIRGLEEELAPMEAQCEALLLDIPNVPHPSVPPGDTEAQNIEVGRWGTPPTFTFTPKHHWELGEALGVLDFNAGAKLSGARFTVLRGGAARLTRALASFMLDTHTARGYTEVSPPFIVRRHCMVGTGQLPKFEEDAFKTTPENEFFLVPTAEVPVTNLHRDEILPGEALPLRYCAYSPCFRAEAGSYGKDTRGLIRQHQFEKVELVSIATAEQSLAELERLTGDAEHILQQLGLHYRKVEHCAGDLGFSAMKSYDLEVWLPGAQEYREVSSCSVCGDFQARRAKIRYRTAAGDKPQPAHTLNGSGLPLGRALVAIFEQYQQADGSVELPRALRPYLGGRTRIEPEPSLQGATR
jgi:seryl-tRNA synthetase